ncbi:hypothetical protein FHR33_008588 [Nonomuraea dietziae]|uniref:Uncharacterized protein n=1 Tax=Nonomuraea dietziae TaxID=65515 RepID=A0A7W5YFB5_9ACTN|nr:hypothetical protein [Nonomuraea dietziae]
MRDKIRNAWVESAHVFALHSPEDVDEQIIDWLREASDA